MPASVYRIGCRLVNSSVNSLVKSPSPALSLNICYCAGELNESSINKLIKEFGSLGNIYGYRIDVSNVDEVKTPPEE